MKRILFACTIMLALCVGNLVAQNVELPDGVKKNASVEGITEYELDNGLRVLLFPDQSKPTITVNVTYLVGSRHEGYGETGMAHLLEHLVFKGTPDHPDIPQELTEHGARPNGTTWYDRTNYFETFSATDENLNWALDMESDRMVNSFIAKEDLDSEMTVVRNEFESGENSTVGVLMKRTMGAAFQWHNYGKSTIGARADLENVPIERLQAFYRKYYQPDNAVLTVAGKFNEQQTLELVNEYFGKIPRPDRELIPTYTKEPTQDGERLVTLRRVGDVQNVSVVYHSAPGPHSDYAAVSVLEQILTNEPSGRLYKALVETKLASSQWGFAPGLKEGGFIYLNADVRKENDLMAAKEAMLAALDDISVNKPTEEEVERAKTSILKDFNLQYNNSDRVGLAMSEFIAQGDWRLGLLYRDRVEAMSVNDVVRVAEKYLVPSNRTIGLFIPDMEPVRAEIPDAPDVRALVANYKGKEEVAVGEEFDPSPSNIESRAAKGEADSGLEFALLRKENRGDAVRATMTMRYGSPKTLLGKNDAASFAASMINRGTSTMSRQDIKDKLDALEARVSIFGGLSSASVRIETTNENLPAVVDLVSEILKDPVFPQEEFDKIKEQRLSSLEESLSDPQSLASNKFSRLLSPYPKTDVRYSRTIEEQIEDIKALTLDEVKSFYAENYGTSNATVSVVGDFDEAVIKEKIISHFGGWDSPSNYKRIENPYIEITPGDEEINTPDKANSLFLAGMTLPFGDESEDYAALLVGNYMLGGGFLNSRLATRIRQQDGLSYGVGSFFNASSMDEAGSFGAYAISAPENTAKVQAAFKEEIMKVINEGFTAEELEAAKSGWLQSQNVNRSQDASLMGMLSTNLYLDRDMMWSQALEDKVSSLTVEQVNSAMKKYIHPNKMVYVKAGDFEKLKENIKP